MKKIILACGLSILGAFSVGCGGNACEDYANKVLDKYESCGVKIETNDAASGSGETACSDAQAKKAECLSPCVDKTPCECVDPAKITAGECTEEKSKDANECVKACGT